MGGEKLSTSSQRYQYPTKEIGDEPQDEGVGREDTCGADPLFTGPRNLMHNRPTTTENSASF